QPQRGPPALVTPVDGWFVVANATSYAHFIARPDGPLDEHVEITAISLNDRLVLGTNLMIYPDPNGQPQVWVLSVIPPANYTGKSFVALIATDEVSMSSTTTVSLTVSLPLPLGAEVLESGNLIWHSSGAAPWFGQTNITHAGVSAAQSGNVFDNEESWLEATVTGPGVLSFWWKVSSEQGYDWLEFYA